MIGIPSSDKKPRLKKDGTEASELEATTVLAAAAGDQYAQGVLLAKYESLVWKFVQKYKDKYTGGDEDDLAQEGRMAILHAATLWSPDKGASFFTHAYQHVWSRVQLVATGDGLIVTGRITSQHSEKTNVAKARARSLASIDAPLISNKGEESFLKDTLAARASVDSDPADYAGLLEDIATTIWPEREGQMILASYRGKTLQEIGEEHGVTRERVRQIISTRKEKMEATLKRAVDREDDIHRWWRRVKERSTGVSYYRRRLLQPRLTRLWLPQHDKKLLSMLDKPWTKVAIELGRTPTAIRNRARRLGVPKEHTTNRRPCEIEVRAYHACGLSTIQIGERMGFSDETIRCCLRRLGLPSNPIRRGTPAHRNAARQNAKKRMDKYRQVAISLGHERDLAEAILLKALESESGDSYSLATKCASISQSLGVRGIATWQSVLEAGKRLRLAGLVQSRRRGKRLWFSKARIVDAQAGQQVHGGCNDFTKQ